MTVDDDDGDDDGAAPGVIQSPGVAVPRYRSGGTQMADLQEGCGESLWQDGVVGPAVRAEQLLVKPWVDACWLDVAVLFSFSFFSHP
jgi:hypothetical protein